MAILWDILDTVRRKLAENLDVRTVLIGDGDVPASLLPAAKIVFKSVAMNCEPSPANISEARIIIELIFLPKTEQTARMEFIHKAIEALSEIEFFENARIVSASLLENDEKKSSATIVGIVRWSERSEE